MDDRRGLEEIARRLERVEKMLEQLNAAVQELLQGGFIAAVGEAARLVAAFSLPAAEALEAARRTIAAARSINDPIAVAIVEALSTCEPLSISEITRRVRSLRGKASRNTVKQKLRLLIDADIVATVEDGKRPKYVLTLCS
ncbi:hypothetical protein [Pyrodictium abyssi]|uniref:Uncharacterized protein n=1 Tax=Pyrodictium abyssi TaxID=54256 RepID=A0ABN6ZTE2_9CREN|nr:hypothetical protein PABY_04450 [Pyrodictium abyssi]